MCPLSRFERFVCPPGLLAAVFELLSLSARPSSELFFKLFECSVWPTDLLANLFTALFTLCLQLAWAV